MLSRGCLPLWGKEGITLMDFVENRIAMENGISPENRLFK
jgi:hypothetical protein